MPIESLPPTDAHLENLHAGSDTVGAEGAFSGDDMDGGWVKLWRKSLENGMMKNPILWTFWTWCLMKASHRPHRQRVGFQEIDLSPGQFIFGRKIASEELGISEKRIRNCLIALKTASNMAIKTASKFSIVTICNWSRYQNQEYEKGQKRGQQKGQQGASKGPARGQQGASKGPARGHKQEGKEGKEGKEDYKKLHSSTETAPVDHPPSPFDLFWSAYPSKTGKKAAKKAWDRAKDKPTIEAILSAIETQKQGRQWKEGFIKNPATWINGGCWDDVVKQEIDPSLSEQMTAEQALAISKPRSETEKMTAEQRAARILENAEKMEQELCQEQSQEESEISPSLESPIF